MYLNLYSLGDVCRGRDKLKLPECSRREARNRIPCHAECRNTSEIARSGPSYQIQLQSLSFERSVRLYSLSRENILLACIVPWTISKKCNGDAAALPKKVVL